MPNDELFQLQKIEKARREEAARRMEDYNLNVYYPALKALRKWCVENGGHKKGKFYDNGFGWSWYYCFRCGDRHDITGPADLDTPTQP